MGALGHRGRKQHKNKPNRGYGRCFRPGFGCYGRGNFPGHDVLGGLQKMPRMSQMDRDRCGWVWWDLWHGGNTKNSKQNRKYMYIPLWTCEFYIPGCKILWKFIIYAYLNQLLYAMCLSYCIWSKWKGKKLKLYN